jgi:hypothetical protein
MSEPRDEGAAAGGAGGGTGESGAAPPPQPAASPHRTLSSTFARFAPSLTLPRLRGREGWGQGRAGWGLGLAGAFGVIALVATGPFWAPLLPWAASSEPAADAPRQPREPPSRPAATPAPAAPQAPDPRVGALDAKPAASESDVAEMRAVVGKLMERTDAIDKVVQSQPAGDSTDAALVLALLQIRDAVEAGRPFRAPYEALAALAQARPEIAAAAAPLAAPATAGLPGRPVLANRLRELAPAIVAATPPANGPPTSDAAASDWARRAWQRLSGLVTIRRIDSAGPDQAATGPAASVNAALDALAGGDLEGAAGALERLTGAPAEAARPWLQMAKERLRAEAALQQIEALLAARLGAPPNAPAGSEPPR